MDNSNGLRGGGEEKNGRGGKDGGGIGRDEECVAITRVLTSGTKQVRWVPAGGSLCELLASTKPHACICENTAPSGKWLARTNLHIQPTADTDVRERASAEGERAS